jgi:hypothetical protein
LAFGIFAWTVATNALAVKTATLIDKTADRIALSSQKNWTDPEVSQDTESLSLFPPKRVNRHPRKFNRICLSHMTSTA